MMTTKKRRLDLHAWAVIAAAGMLLTACSPPGARDLRRGERDIKEGNFAEAIGRLKDATQTLAYAPRPQQAKAWNLLGSAYQGAGHLDDASQAYSQALKLDHNNTAVDFNLGCLRMEQGNFQGAVDYLTTCVQLKPREVNGYLKLASARYHLALGFTGGERVRQLQNARLDYQAADKVYPTAEAANGIGMIDLQRRNGGMEAVRAAAMEFQTALQRDPHYPAALLNLAILYEQYFHDIHKALQEYHEYVTLQPPPPHVNDIEKLARQLDLESRIFIGSEPKQRAAPPSRAAPVPNNPSPVRPRNTSSEPPISQVENPIPTPAPAPEKQVESVQTETSAPPPAPPPKSVEPSPASSVPAASQSAPSFNPAPLTNEVSPTATAIATAPTNVVIQPAPPPRKTLGQKLNPLHWFSGKSKGENDLVPEGTRYNYPPSVTLIPGNRLEAERLAQEGAEARRAAHLDEAVRDYRKAIAADPTYFGANLSLGLTAIDRKDYRTALDALDQALVLDENSADARYAFAWTLEQRGYYIDAAKELERLLVAHPQEVRAHLLLGNLYAEKLGEPKQAREQYLKVLALDPGNLQAPTLRAWIQGAR
jgi:tetratricopeptide (TPR) repeat protein